ncbi:MAG TPA: hypothetical protein VHB18_09720 [Mycobacteriales bacterium]|nr:hypothetical protein [Mycobacteriales bacterium]
MSRTRGAVVGPLLMLFGAWGALIPFFGHSFGYGFTPDNTWTWTAARGWLEVLPGAVTFAAGLAITLSAHRVSAMVAGWLAAAAGAWFVIGTVISPWWNAGFIGTPSGGSDRAVAEHLGMFSGLGVVIVCLAGIAIGRISVIGVRDISGGQEQLDAYRRIENAEAYPGGPPRVIDLTAREPERSEPAFHDSPH